MFLSVSVLQNNLADHIFHIRIFYIKNVSHTLVSLRLLSRAGWHLHVWREAGGEVGQRDGRAVGVQHPQAHLVATETSPASSPRPGGPHRPRGGVSRRRAGDADLLRLLSDLQLHQQSSGVQHPWVHLLTLLPSIVFPPVIVLIVFYWWKSNAGTLQVVDISQSPCLIPARGFGLSHRVKTVKWFLFVVSFVLWGRTEQKLALALQQHNRPQWKHKSCDTQTFKFKMTEQLRRLELSHLRRIQPQLPRSYFRCQRNLKFTPQTIKLRNWSSTSVSQAFCYNFCMSQFKRQQRT